MKLGFVKNFVDKIVCESGTSGVFEIAKKNGVSIQYESWFPITIGEFERKTKTIRVNLRALKDNSNRERLEKMIIAHELGHFFAKEFNFDKKDEEVFAHEFAESLISSAENRRIRK